jgi:hypothetical protein
MAYRLKRNEPAFEVVDGPLAGRKFEHGKIYLEIPGSEAHRFEDLGEAKVAPAKAAAKKDAGGDK